MQRQLWKENIKFDDEKKKKEDEKKKEKKRNNYDPASYPFGADELLLRSELEEIEKSGGR